MFSLELFFETYFSSSWLTVYDDLKKCTYGISLDYTRWPFLHRCVFMLSEEMEVLYPYAFYNCPQFVLAKNLPKGEIVGYFYWLHYC